MSNGAAMTGCAPEKRGQVFSGINAIESETDHLITAVTELSERLKPIATPEPPQEPEEKKENELVPLAARLNDAAARIRYQRQNIEGLFARLEI